MDYRAEDDAILRKVTIEALQRVGKTITYNDTRGYLNVACNDAGELRMALQGAEILRRESGQGPAARNYYNIECALRQELATVAA